MAAACPPLYYTLEPLRADLAPNARARPNTQRPASSCAQPGRPPPSDQLCSGGTAPDWSLSYFELHDSPVTTWNRTEQYSTGSEQYQ